MGKMKVRLTGRWGSRLPGSIISVSRERAIYLQDELRLGRILRDEAQPEPVAEPEKKKPGKK